MTKPNGVDSEDRGFPLRTLSAMNHILQSASSDADRRVAQVLVCLRDVVPYDECAVLCMARIDESPRLITPTAATADRARLSQTLTPLLRIFVDVPPRGPPRAARPGAHLALPLIGDSEVVGLLFVHSDHGEYRLRHLQLLADVAGKLGAYAAMRRATARIEQLSRLLAETRGGTHADAVPLTHSSSTTKATSRAPPSARRRAPARR